MSCDEIQERLNDYVDGGLSEAEFHELELHLAGCAACREEERLLRSLITHAAALPEAVEPPRDLWPGIAERLGRQPRRVLWFPQRPQLRWAAGLAAAAALVMALAAVIGERGRLGTDAGRQGERRMVSASPSAGSLGDAERQYAEATAALLATLETRRSELPPETLAAVERNLAAIDQALGEIRVALAQDPSSPHLNRLLASTHHRKVEMLQQVVRLSL